jgi:NADH:ubiquinone reductase (non-electrogenic)
MKEVEDGIKVQKQILQKLEIASALQKNGTSEEEIRKHLHWVIIGGGPTGVELTGEITDFIRGDINRYFPSISSLIKVTLIEGTSRLLGPFDPRMAGKIMSLIFYIFINHL